MTIHWLLSRETGRFATNSSSEIAQRFRSLQEKLAHKQEKHFAKYVKQFTSRLNTFLSKRVCIETTGNPVKEHFAEFGHVLGYDYDFLKVLRFSFAVPVVGPSALSLSLCHRKHNKFLARALRLRRFWARLLGKSRIQLTNVHYHHKASIAIKRSIPLKMYPSLIFL